MTTYPRWMQAPSARFSLLLVLASVVIAKSTPLHAESQPALTVSQSTKNLEAYDFIEVSLNVPTPAANPFTGATVRAVFRTGGKNPIDVEGFCDSADGHIYRVRYMPSTPGEYTYTVTYSSGPATASFDGKFSVRHSDRRGPIRVDAAHPWHFVWEGTGEHYFMNGTTAFWLMGWKDDHTIDYSIARLARLKVNRMRVLLSGRTDRFYGDAVMNGQGDNQWDTFLPTWPAKDLKDFARPGFDYSRFDVRYWQRFDQMLRFAREHNIIISVVLDIVDSSNHVKEFSEDDRRYVSYAIARLSAFSNITWDLGDDCDTFHSDKWTHDTGTFITRADPVHHLATSHPVNPAHQDRTAEWFGFTSFQQWSRSQHEFILKQRALQKETGHIIPQSNEEYGYEDHYPLWAEGPGSESADTLRRTAWDIYMAGGYQTAGETARRGTNVWPDSGGGWFNGRGDDTMTMFYGYGHILEFMTSFEWWKTEPRDDLVSNGAYCLSEAARSYAIYLPRGGTTTVKVDSGKYSVTEFYPQTGETVELPAVEGTSWTSPEMPKLGDWAFLLRRK